MINDEPSKPHPKAIIRQLLYTYIFDDDPESAANRAIAQTLPKLKTNLSTAEIISTIRKTLQDSSPLTDILPCKHSETEIRSYFEAVASKIEKSHTT